MSALHKVLVVDDDPVVGKSYDRVLSAKGYVVTTAENAAQALERIRGEDYDLVVTDIRMPGMDGLELAETVKARRPWTPVLIVTGYGTEADEKRAKAAGVKSFLHKPLTPEMIEGSAAEALRTATPAVAAEAMTVEAPALEAAPTRTTASRIKDVALFLAAPFIGLVYAVFLPVVGLGIAVWFGVKALMKNKVMSRAAGVLATVGKVAAAPFIGLAYIIALPFAGLAALAWFGGQAVLKARRGR